MSARRLGALVAALAMVTVGCADSVDDAEIDSSTTTTGNDDSPDDSANEPDDAAPSDVELTASAPGVTETAIRIGVMSVDTEELASLGVVVQSGDIEAQWQSFIDAVNADGGVLGRQLEPHFVTYSALSDTASEVACVELTEDIQVFWVGGTILRDNPICFTEFHETIAFSAQAASPDAVERAAAPFRSLPPIQTDQATVFAQASMEAGIYGDGPVGVIQAGADPGPVEVVAAALREEGLEVIEGPISAPAEDQFATDQETAALFERFRTDGVETVVLAGIGAGPLTVAEEAGYDEFDFALTTALNSGIIERQGIDTSLLDGVFSVAESLIGTADQELLRDDLGVQRCVGIYEQAAGEGTVEFDPTAGLENLGPTLQACDLVDVLVAVATEAGAELTNETFGGALDSIGDLDLATVPFASGVAGKFGLSDTAIPVRYDADVLLWALDGDPVDTRN